MMKSSPFSRKHFDEVVELISHRYAELLSYAPILPERYREYAHITPLLESIVDNAPGVVAYDDDVLVGFISGWLLERFRGRRAIFSPEWGNAARFSGSRRIYEQMYACISKEWLQQDCYTHLVCQYADRQSDIDAWNWLGFGMIAADGARDLEPLSLPPTNYVIKQAQLENTGDTYGLVSALSQHLAGPPTFLYDEDALREDEVAASIADPEQIIWLCFKDNVPVGFLHHGPASENACTIIRDPGTTSITGLYVIPEERGRGTAAYLLNKTLEQSKISGYRRCCVDFEPMNHLGARFWTRHFTTVSITMQRDIDSRIPQDYL